MYVYMSKIISVSDDVYKNLSILKGNESYSVLLRKLLELRNNKIEILRFAGMNLVDENIIKDSKKDWKKWSDKYA